MKRLLTGIGLSLALLPTAALAQRAGMYDLFRAQVLREQTQGESVDTPVIEFLQKIYRDRWQLRPEEIAAAIRGQPWEACSSTSPNAAQRHVVECGRALENIQLLADEEQSIRTFGRNLQRIASAQELPISEIPGRPFHLTTDLSGIINIWRAGTGSVQQNSASGMLIRTRALTDEEADLIREPFERLASGLSLAGNAGAVNEEMHVAGVWYYQYGARLRSGSRSPAYPPPLDDGKSGHGTERQYLFYDDFGHGVYLEAIWGALVRGGITFDPPLSGNEVAYILLPDDMTALLPDNILVWIRLDGEGYVPGAGELYPLGDAGLAWKYPTEPMLPSLISVEQNQPPILGGRYPPEPANARFSNDDGSPAPPGAKEPVDGRGLCSMAIAQRGYLCRPLQVTDEQRCPSPEQGGDENVITLVSCTLEDEPTLTVAGVDVCREIEWLNGRDENALRCVVDPNIDDEYELVKIQQRCVMRVDDPYAGKEETEQDALCCRLEGEAHLVACRALINGGGLRDDGGNPVRLGGVEITPQTCMEILRLDSCRDALERDVRCPVTSPALTADLADGLREAMAASPGDDPEKEARIAARIRTIERQFPVCEPGAESSYKNTIGNNACYIGQCVEESLELHRLTGGRSPATVGDGAFPYDDPDTGDALATVLRSVPAASPPLPSYRPQMVARTLEDALCQLQGLPAATPPHLCAFSPSRRLAVPLEDGATTARSLLNNVEEQREAEILTEELAAGLGSRIGTDMQGQYLRIGTRTLSEVVALANLLLRDAVSVTFPLNMCPLSL